MTTSQLLTSAWEWEPSVVAGCAALVGLYVWQVRGHLTPTVGLYMLGALVLLLSLVSPLDALGDTYLFSAHMVQHMLLVLVVPPLLLLGTPAYVWEILLSRPAVSRAERILSAPAVAWVLAMGTLCLWHVPALYDAALGSERLHIFQHLTFLVTSTIFWWPILSPVRERRHPPLAGVAYLFVAAMVTSLLGIVFTFAPEVAYAPYLNPDDELGALSLVRDAWGLTPLVDQELGGLVMWVPGSLVYLFGMMAALAGWYSAPEGDEETPGFPGEAQLPLANASMEEV